jgi:pyruvate dehydrogenase E2 component (dihydrolipoamide acetyltransferase)
VAAPAAGGVSAPAPAEKLFATPRAKMIASEMGIDLKNVTPANALRIVEADVRRAAAAGGAKPAAAMPTAPESKYKLGQKIPLNRLQKIVAEKMVWSKQNIPCFYLNVRVDATALFALRTKLNKSGRPSSASTTLSSRPWPWASSTTRS